MIAVGLVILAAAGAVALNGVSLPHFSLALILLGLGWNFGFIGATAMLTAAHTHAERGRVQGMNDFAVFGLVCVGSLASGGLMNCSGGDAVTGWTAVNLAMAPLLAAAGGALIWLALRRPPAHQRRLSDRQSSPARARIGATSSRPACTAPGSAAARRSTRSACQPASSAGTAARGTRPRRARARASAASPSRASASDGRPSGSGSRPRARSAGSARSSAAVPAPRAKSRTTGSAAPSAPRCRAASSIRCPAVWSM